MWLVWIITYGLTLVRREEPVVQEEVVAATTELKTTEGRSGGASAFQLPIGKRQEAEPLISNQSSERVWTTRASRWSQPGQRRTAPGASR